MGMIKILDNFFKDPYEIRKIALSSQFFLTSDEWPGRRAEVLDPYRTAYSNQYRKFFDEPAELYENRMHFQLIDKSWIEGVCHPDLDVTYTVITYLNLECPFDSGTEIYGKVDEFRLGDDRKYFNQVKRDFYSSNRNRIDKFLFKKELKKFNSGFKDPCIVANRFNRTLIFHGDMVHRAQNFFGNILSNSRLTLVSFYK